MLYPIGFSIALISLMLWQNQEGKKSEGIFRLFFSLAIIAYIVGLFSFPSTFEAKAIHIVKDFVILGVASLLVKGSRQNLFLSIAAFSFSLVGAYLFFTDFENHRIGKDFTVGGIQEAPVDHADILVEVFEGESKGTLISFAKEHGLSIEPAFAPQSTELTDLDDYFVINIPSGLEDRTEKFMNLIKKLKGVEWVEHNEFVKTPILETKNIQKKNKNFGLNDPDVNLQWGFAKMEMDKFYTLIKEKKLKPKKKALIAILDTGVDAKHEDLSKHFKSIDKKSDTDGNKHGTHCAGIAAAVSNNKKGIASLAPNDKFIEVTSVKVLQSFGGGTQNAIIAGIIKAADSGADVISMSLGGRSNDKNQKAYKEAVDYANKKGAIVIAAAGNSNANAKFYAPANTPGVITVAAVDRDLSKAKFSNFVNDIEMGIAAPGVEIHSTIPNDKYAAFSGTSMATPQVAGLVAMMKALKPSLDTREVYNILNDSGLEIKDHRTTGNMIQPYQALMTLSGSK